MNLSRITATVCAVGLAVGLSFSAPSKAVLAALHGPKNVIVLIGDGMGYNQIASATLYEHGVAYKQVEGAADAGADTELPGTASYAFQQFPVQVDMATFSYYGSYDPQLAWSDFDYVRANPTDSAAAATAMATGVKTYNTGIGVDIDGNPVENTSECAIALGKAAGSISSVQYSHATPASFVAHIASRNDYLGIAKQEVASQMTIIMGAGNPWFTDDGALRATPSYEYISEADYIGLQHGVHNWDLVESGADFEALTTGDTPERVFGIAQVATTLQQARTTDEFNSNVPDLATMTKGALNVLDNDPQGFSLMVEGGAIDRSGHANQTRREIEETVAFNRAVDAVIEWVETNSNWRETLVIVTADHETGYLEGAGTNPDWTPLEGVEGQLPSQSWNSNDHTNQLVPVFAKGAGAEKLERLATMTDPVRGAYLDNTAIAKVLLNDLWAECSSAAEVAGGPSGP